MCLIRKCLLTNDLHARKTAKAYKLESRLFSVASDQQPLTCPNENRSPPWGQPIQGGALEGEMRMDEWYPVGMSAMIAAGGLLFLKLTADEAARKEHQLQRLERRERTASEKRALRVAKQPETEDPRVVRRPDSCRPLKTPSPPPPG